MPVSPGTAGGGALLTSLPAPVDSAQYARTVREDTAELAKYQLSDDADGRNPSFLARKSSQSLLGRRGSVSTEGDADDVETGPSRLAAEAIVEASEPPSPEVDLDAPPLASPSLLARALQMYDQATQAAAKPHAHKGSTASSATEVEAQQRPRPSARSSRRSEIADAARPTEGTPLLRGRSHESRRLNGSDGHYDLEGQKLRTEQQPGKPDQRDPGVGRDFVQFVQLLSEPKRWDRKAVWQNAVVAPVSYLPAVTVGLLLNILDALSYGTSAPKLVSQGIPADDETGMILFPLGSPIFANLGSAGISIFYVSTIISQLIFSFGSIFKGAIGSELVSLRPHQRPAVDPNWRRSRWSPSSTAWPEPSRTSWERTSQTPSLPPR